MSEPLFSIIVAAYNRGEMLRSALETIRRQTLGDFECLGVDDGSTDCAPKVFRDFESDPRFSTLTLKPNRGMNQARNAALEIAKGRWVTFLDSDDFWLPERLEAFKARMDAAPGAGFVFSNCWVLRWERIIGTLFSLDMAIPEGKVPGHYAVGDKWLPYVTTNMAIVRSAFERWGGFKPGLKATDTELFARFLAQGLEVAAIKEPLAVRRVHEDQITAGHAGNYDQSVAALPSAGVDAATTEAMRRQVAIEVATHLVKAGRPSEARAFLKDKLGDEAKALPVWRAAGLPAFVLRGLRDARAAYMKARFHPALLSPGAREAMALVAPFLEAERAERAERGGARQSS